MLPETPECDPNVEEVAHEQGREECADHFLFQVWVGSEVFASRGEDEYVDGAQERADVCQLQGGYAGCEREVRWRGVIRPWGLTVVERLGIPQSPNKAQRGQYGLVDREGDEVE